MLENILKCFMELIRNRSQVFILSIFVAQRSSQSVIKISSTLCCQSLQHTITPPPFGRISYKKSPYWTRIGTVNRLNLRAAPSDLSIVGQNAVDIMPIIFPSGEQPSNWTLATPDLVQSTTLCELKVIIYFIYFIGIIQACV